MITAYRAYRSLFDSTSEAIAFEEKVLSTPVKELPTYAKVVVKYGSRWTGIYWEFLTEQYKKEESRSC